MSLLVPGLSWHPWTYDNFGASPSTGAMGASFTPGASNAEGTYAQIASAANVANDVYWIQLFVTNGSTSLNQKSHLLDIGVDNAGGTSYTTVVSNIVCGDSGTHFATVPGHSFLFPMFIKAGSTIAVRFQGSNGTAGTVRVWLKLYGQPTNPEMMPIASFSETIGTITNSSGVSFTPGNAADGTWVSLGTTTNALWWWQLGYQIDNGTITQEDTYIDLAFGDATNKHVIKRAMHGGSTTEQIGDILRMNMSFLESYCPVPAGATLYVRGRCSDAPDTGYNAVAVGFGG